MWRLINHFVVFVCVSLWAAVVSCRQISIRPNKGLLKDKRVNSQPVFVFEAPKTRPLPIGMSGYIQYEFNRSRISEEVLLLVFELVSQSNETVLKMLTKAHIQANQSSGIVNLGPRVGSWLEDKTQLRLVLDCVGCGEFRISRDLLLNLRIDDGSPRRRRQKYRPVPRSPAACINGTGGCCKRDLFVDFSKLGWDFIIEPVTYNIGYCQGNCNEVMHYPDVFQNHYFFILNEIRKKKPRFKDPCCVPIRFSGMSILYSHPGSEEIIKQDYKNMVVEECGCL